MKKRLAILALLLCAALLYSGCAKQASPQSETKAYDGEYLAGESMENGDYGVEADDTAGVETPQAETTTGGSTQEVQKLIVTAKMSLSADDPQAAVEALRRKAEQLGGYASDSDLRTDEKGVRSGSVTLRVAPEKLDELVSAAGALGQMDSYTMNSQEITQEYWDIQARLTNAKAQETQLLALLGQCTTVEDTLKVRDALSDVQREIEQYQGQIKLWDYQVGYSTLDVSVTRTATAEVAGEKGVSIWNGSDVWNRMKTGFANTGKTIVNVFYFVLIALAYLAIPLLIAGAVALAIVLLVRARKNRKAKKQ
ncbi:MAG: DUF4349 domain-containing protein [Eubacteriales bacterium]|nr:DUF4349 domain-containing protein [Eubacteriales bacterium]